MKRFAYKVAARLRSAYWFVFRPRTFGVKCAVEHNGRLLLIRTSYAPSYWTFPGGAIERGEGPDEAARREVAEEVGIELSTVEPLGSYYSTAEHKRDTVHCFRASVSSPEHVIRPSEIAEAKWFLPADIPTFRGGAVDQILAMMEQP